MLLSQAMDMAVTRFGANVAFKCPHHPITYRQMNDMLHKISYDIQNNVGYHKKVALFSGNNPFIIGWLFGLANNANTCIPINPDIRDELVIHILEDSKPDFVASDPLLTPRLRDIQKQCPHRFEIIEVEKKWLGAYDSRFKNLPSRTLSEKDVILVLYTSGTTGKPKGCEFNHQNLYHLLNFGKLHMQLAGNDTVYTPLSFAHPFALIHAVLLPLQSGASILMLNPSHTLEDQCDQMKTDRLNTLVCPPRYLERIRVMIEQQHIHRSFLRKCFTSLYPIPEATQTTIHDLWPELPVQEIMGFTEFGWAVSINRRGEEGRAGSLGRMLPGLEAKIVDAENNTLLQANSSGLMSGMSGGRSGAASGQLCVRGPSATQKYHLNADKTAAVFRGGWFQTGLQVNMDSEGFIRLSDESRRQALAALPSDDANETGGLGQTVAQATGGGGSDPLTGTCEPDASTLSIFESLDSAIGDAFKKDKPDGS